MPGLTALEPVRHFFERSDYKVTHVTEHHPYWLSSQFYEVMARFFAPNPDKIDVPASSAASAVFNVLVQFKKALLGAAIVLGRTKSGDRFCVQLGTNRLHLRAAI